MTKILIRKEAYSAPIVESGELYLPDILCSSPDDWGNENPEPGDPWQF